eukprot:338648-Chlamydomonas_euryale.AAC.2
MSSSPQTPHLVNSSADRGSPIRDLSLNNCETVISDIAALLPATAEAVDGVDGDSALVAAAAAASGGGELGRVASAALSDGGGGGGEDRQYSYARLMRALWLYVGVFHLPGAK